MAAFRRSPTPLSGERLFAWALGAPYHVAHGTPVDGPEERGGAGAEKSARESREMLSGAWGVEGRDHLVARMTRLGLEGHRRTNRERVNRFATLWRPEVAAAREECLLAIREGGEEAEEARSELWLMDAVQADLPGLRGSSLLAFDTARGAMLAREGLFLGWLGEDEAWDYLMDAARDARRTYGSWEGYAADYVLSRNIWAGQTKEDEFDAAVRRLLQAPDSPWRTVPWHAPGPDPEVWTVPRAVRQVPADRPLWTLERN